MSTVSRYRYIAIVEDDNQVREIYEDFFSKQEEIVCLFTANSAESFFEILNVSELPEIVLMDIGLPGINGIECMELLKSMYPGIEVIMLTIHHDHDSIFQSLCAGASGYILKNIPLDEIKKGILSLADGGSPMSPQIARRVIERFRPLSNLPERNQLSDRENEVVKGIVDGSSYKMIAHELSISIDTVRFHIKNIYKKLHINCKAELISKTLKQNIQKL